MHFFRFQTLGLKKVLLWTLVLTGLWMGTSTVVSAFLDDAAADIRQAFFIQSSCQVTNSQQVHLEWTQVDRAEGYRVRVCRGDLPGQCPDAEGNQSSYLPDAEGNQSSYLLDTYQETHVISPNQNIFNHTCLSTICRYSVVSFDRDEESIASFSAEFIMDSEVPAELPPEEE